MEVLGGHTEDTEDEAQPSEREPAEELAEMAEASPLVDSLFSCPVEGCVCTFQKYHNLENHMFYGKCRLLKERHTLLDKAKLLYHEKLSEGFGGHPFTSSTAQSKPAAEVIQQGWALKTSKKSKRFNDNQKSYLNDKFQIGQETGIKADPEDVSQDMRHAKMENGERRFTVDEFMTSQQIKSYLSRRAAKVKNLPEKISGSQDREVEEEVAYSSIRNHIVNECHVMHPITYDSYNICQLYSDNKLTRLSVALLRYICTYFGLEVSGLPDRRKAPYISLITGLVQSCPCSFT